MRNDRKLTLKQARFVEEYLIDLNGTKAAIRAGYSERTARQQGQRLLTKAVIVEAINEALAARSERTKIDQDWVLRTIYETAERCKQAVPVLDGSGRPVMVETPRGSMSAAYTFEASAVLKGAELAGRHLKMFTDKTESTVKVEKVGYEIHTPSGVKPVETEPQDDEMPKIPLH